MPRKNWPNNIEPQITFSLSLLEQGYSLDIHLKYEALQRILGEIGEVLIAFSGGVDSTLLLKVAGDTLGDKVLAVTALSATTPDHEIEDARDFARLTGVRHMEITSNELDLPEFTQNRPEKCYVCKKSRFGELVQIATEQKIPYVVDGENVDDAADYRPGSIAARELKVRSPLKEAGLTKMEIRELSKMLGLTTWDKPSNACLASRIPYGQVITPEKLRQVDAAELFIRNLGLSKEVRVRHEGATARIEVAAGEIETFLDETVRHRIVAYLKELGFLFVALDLEGYGMGRLNRMVADPVKQPSQTEEGVNG